jgi:hypothetical protein
VIAARAGAAGLLVLTLVACGGSDGDVKAYCKQIEHIIDDPPFEQAVATPAEMQRSFEGFVQDARDLDDVAPDEARAATARWKKAVEHLNDLQAAAGYNATRLDALEYQAAVDDYLSLSKRLDATKQDLC